MARVKVIDRRPGPWRLLALFTVTALFTAISYGPPELLSQTHVMVVPGRGMVSYTIYVAKAVLSLVVFLAIMVWLSFSEQRVRCAMLEGLALSRW